MNDNSENSSLKNVSRIDQRWNIRQALELEVSLYRDLSGGRNFISTQTGNISMGGMFINAPPDQLSTDDTLSVAFTLQTKQGISHHRLPMRVVRTTQRGAALVFNDYNIDTIHMLREILYDGAQEH